MNVKKIRVFVVSVTDQERAKAFYVDKLGFTVMHDMTVGPVRWLQVGPTAEGTGIILLPGFYGPPPGSVQEVQLETMNIGADCESLRMAGVAVDGPHERPWGFDASFRDPDGNLFVLVTPLRGAS